MILCWHQALQSREVNLPLHLYISLGSRSSGDSLEGLGVIWECPKLPGGLGVIWELGTLETPWRGWVPEVREENQGLSRQYPF